VDVAGNYTHSLTKGESTEGSIAVAVMGAQIGLSRHGDKSVSDTGNLTVSAHYEGILPEPASGG
jgi:hypothetical protein